MQPCNKCGRVLPPNKPCGCGMPPRPITLNKKCCYEMFRRVDIPADIDNNETNPPANGAYKNALVVYAATGNKYLYTSDGIPTLLNSGGGEGGTTNFDRLTNRPKYGGITMTSATDIPDLSGAIADISEEMEGLRPWVLAQGYQNADQVAAVIEADLINYYTKQQVDDKIALIPQFNIKVVNELPTEDISPTTIYLVQGEGTTYQEWIYAEDDWVQLGTQSIDLSNYYTKPEVEALLNTALANYYTKAQVDALLANYMTKEEGVKLIMTTTDPGEGSDLAANTILGVYE